MTSPFGGRGENVGFSLRSAATLRAYPRAGGGTPNFKHVLPRRWGLSPRVRGNLVNPRSESIREGSIPARAGEPTTAARRWASGTVYPRACGGTFSTSASLLSMRGLSPRVRGNPSPTVTEADMMGPIPARAGEPCAYCT